MEAAENCLLRRGLVRTCSAKFGTTTKISTRKLGERVEAEMAHDPQARLGTLEPRQTVQQLAELHAAHAGEVEKTPRKHNKSRIKLDAAKAESARKNKAWRTRLMKNYAVPAALLPDKFYFPKSPEVVAVETGERFPTTVIAALAKAKRTDAKCNILSAIKKGCTAYGVHWKYATQIPNGQRVQPEEVVAGQPRKVA